MESKKRFEFKSPSEFIGWLNTSGSSHLEDPQDVFVKPTKWGLFVWNSKSFYPIENAVSCSDTEVSHGDLVCRPVLFQ